MPLNPDPTRGNRHRSGPGAFRAVHWRAWQYAAVAVALVLAAGTAGASFARAQGHAAPASASSSSPGMPGSARLAGTASASAPVPTRTATAPRGGSTGGAVPAGGASYAGSLTLDDTGAQLTSWNQTSSYCKQQSWQVANGTVTTDGSGDALLSTSGTGSCVALISPQQVSSGVIEARLDFPALPGHPDTIANWTSFWLTNTAHWPAYGELDAVEVEPVNGVNAASWHSGSQGSEVSASTDPFAQQLLPRNAPNVTPGWHTVDIVYTRGFLAVYYDGRQYTSYTSPNVTGDPLNIFITTGVTADNSAVRGAIGGPPLNSDGSPSTYAVKYLRVWSFR